MARRYPNLERKLGYTFRDEMLLERALTNTSHVEEHRAEGHDHNERLEWLGDAVLGLALSRLLYDRFPDLRESGLHKLRESIEGKPVLAAIAADLGLGPLLLLGNGAEQQGGRTNPKLLADAYEAIVAAIYLDSDDFARTIEVIRPLFEPHIRVP